MTGRQIMTGRCVESVEPSLQLGVGLRVLAWSLPRRSIPTSPLYPYLAALSADAPGIEIQPGTEIQSREASTLLESGTRTLKGGTHDTRPPARKPG